MDAELLKNLRRHGDRSSSFITSYPSFQGYRRTVGEELGEIRFASLPHARGTWVAGSEPLASAQDRAALFSEFTQTARLQGRRSMMLPVTETLSAQLVTQGYQRLQIGAEPQFELAKYFTRPGRDPLENFPLAKALLRRGAQVLEWESSSVSAEGRKKLDTLVEAWKRSRRSVPLGFLSQVDPWRQAEFRKIFVLEVRGRVQAFVSTAPVFPGKIIFFADVIRSPEARAGSVELLFIEAMRRLFEQGFEEVRLGMCPLAQLDPGGARTFRESRLLRTLQWVFKHWTWIYSFRSIYEFKAKLKPTRWEPLYIVSKDSMGWRTFLDLYRVNYPEGALGIDLSIRKVRWTLSFGILFLALHWLRLGNPTLQAFFETYGFSAANPSLLGWIVSPLFHTNSYHLMGDLLSFLVFGAAFEMFTRPRFYLLILALGLWAPNPFTWGLLASSLAWISPTEYSRFLLEVDYGSSNAIYAFVGALAAFLPNPTWLLTPFIINGGIVCLLKASWISLHHWVALGIGYWICKAIRSKSLFGK